MRSAPTILFAMLFAAVPASAQQGAIGAANGLFAVSDMGAATYAIPVEVPQGVGGLRPDIALTYNSQCGNGVCGVGFAISGVSSIARVARSVYYDDSAKGVTRDAADAYALDGRRLLLLSGSDGHDGARYGMEDDPLTEFILHGGGAGQWWEVRIEGVTLKFGSTHAGRDMSGSCAAVWHVDYVTDSRGNFMEYAYSSGRATDQTVKGGLTSTYPSEIRYGGNASQGLGSINSVKFEYEPRPDKIPTIGFGTKGQVSYRLKSITSATKSAVYRRYDISYAVDGGMSKITSVKVRGTGDESLTAASFSWGNSLPVNTVVVAFPNACGRPVDEQYFMADDVTGDGRANLLAIANESNDKQTIYVYDVKNGAASLLYKNDIPRSGTFKRGIVTLSAPSAYTYADVTGDGINDIVVPTISSETAIIPISASSFLPATLSYGSINFIVCSGASSRNFLTAKLNSQRTPPLYAIGDLFGVGVSSIVYLESTAVSGKYHFGYNTPKSQNFDKSLAVALPKPPRKIFCSDYDGDGLCDILVTYEGGYAIAWNQGGGQFSANNVTQYSGWGDYDVMRMGDFNGDGYVDLVCNNRDSNELHLLTSNGDGTFSRSVAISTLDIADHGFTERDNDRFSIEVVDFDGDGRSDAVVTKSVYKKRHDISGSWGVFQKTYTYWLKSDGRNLTLEKKASSDNADDGLCSRFVTGDFDGDGRAELMNYGYDCHASSDAKAAPKWHIYGYGEPVSANKVTRIIGDYERTVNIGYAPLSDESVYHKQAPNIGCAFPAAIPLHVVSSTTEDNGAAGSRTTHYRYEGLYVMPQGKGILGFRKMTADNITLGSSTSCENELWDSAYYVPTKVTTTHAAGVFSSTSATSLSIEAKGGRRFFAHPAEIVETDIYGNRTTTSYEYDAATSCQPVSQTTTYADGSYARTTQTYVKAGGAYRPAETTTSKKSADAESAFSTTDTYSYDAYGDLVTHTENADKNAAITHSYRYDALGNVIFSGTSWRGGALPATTYTYDATGRFVARAEQEGLVITEYAYDAFGNLVSETDATDAANKLTTTYAYDGFGRMTTTTDRIGVKTTCSRTKLSRANRFFSISVATDGRAPVTTYYDNCGREVASETTRAHGVRTSSARSYDKFGSLSTVTSKIGDITTAQSFRYDNLGRLVSKAGTSIPYTTYTYSNRKVVVRDNSNNRSYSTAYDALGNVVSASDGVAAVNYSYASCGEPAKIVSCGAAYSMQYDDLGRQTSLSDPDAGTSRYEYDAIGRLVSSTDARGVMTTCAYDTYGNQTSSTCGATTTTYTYGSTAATRRLLLREANGAQSIRYTYDKYHRLAAKAYVIDGEEFTYSYAYDQFNRLLSVLTPLGKEEFRYDSYGNMEEILFAGRTVWKLDSYTGKRHVALLGGTLKKQLTTDSYGLPKTQSLSDISTGAVRSKQTYTFGAKSGNLERRTGVNNAAETFTYDAADRLTTVSMGDSVALSMTYADNGNITDKTGVGRYSYGSARPHAVTGVENPLKTISEEPQDIVYTPFNKVQSITQADKKLTIEYGPGQQRVKTVYTRGETTETRVYAGDFERLTRNGSTISYQYIYSPDGLVGICVKPDDAPAQIHYAATDHLGSLLALFGSDSAQTYSATYDALGRQSIAADSVSLRRGYCLHEHWPEFGLIDMNGRFYDPQLGRFLSPDPYVQDITNPQNLNRYSYCLNNPLKYTDPTGEFFHIIIGAAIGGAVNLISGLVSHKVDNVGKGFAYFGIGALAGAASAAVGGGLGSAMAGTGFSAGFTGSAAAASATSSFATGAAIGGAGGAISGSVTGLGNTLVDGGGIGRAVGQMHLQGLIDGASGAVVGGVAGGIKSTIEGENFWYGCKKEKVAEYALPNGGLKVHRQAKETVGCTQEVMKSVGEYKGQPIDIDLLDMNRGEDAKQLADNFCFKTSPSVTDFSNKNIAIIATNLNAGNPTVLTYNNCGTMHTVGVNKVTIYKRITMFNNIKFSYKIQVMNPLRSKYQTFNSFKNGVARIIF